MRVSELQSSDSLLITGNVFLRQLRNRSGRKWKCHTFSCVWLFATLWTIAWQGLQSIEFSKSKNTGVGYHFLPQGIFLIQGSNLGILHCRHILYRLSQQGSGGGKTSPHLPHFEADLKVVPIGKPTQAINKLHNQGHSPKFTILWYKHLWKHFTLLGLPETCNRVL